MIRFLFLVLPLSIFAQIPSYYQSVDFTQSGEDLEQDIANLIIATHANELDYTPEVWDALKRSDLNPENQENVFLIYGYDDSDDDFVNDRTRDKDLSCHSNSCDGKWVREHVFPKSLGNPSFETEGPGADAHAIRSVDYTLNARRSNRKFVEGEGNSAVTAQGYFYPGDEWKGDVARMMMYMHIRYGNRCTANQVGQSTHTYNAEMPDIFLQWNAEDPVAQHELVRNEVLEEMQGNRNPFIDNPYLATKIWGGPDAENTWGNMSVQDEIFAVTQIYPNPSSDTFQIESNKTIGSITVFSVSGQKILSENIYKKNAQIFTDELNNGLYIALVNYTDGTKETKRLIVKK